MENSDRVVLTTCPRDCYDACGMQVRTRAGSIVHVRGDPDHSVARGQLCRKCSIGYNGVWLDPNVRLTHPLRRTGPKGTGAFERITWPEAEQEIAGRLDEIINTSGPAAVLNTHYSGTLSLIACKFPMRFFNRLGATEVSPDTICNDAGHAGLGYVFGTSTVGFDPRTARDAACIIVWGANPSASAPHAHDHWLPEAPGKVIVVDPIRTPTAEIADLHLQPFPGSDAALAFSLLHAIRSDGLVDRSFIEAHTVGWPEVEALLDDCTPEWGEEKTGVPATDIVETARLYGSAPSLLWLGQGLQRQRTGGNVIRACSLLPAATGNLGRPGSGFLYLNGSGSRGVDSAYLEGSHLLEDAPPSVSQMDLAPRLEDSTQSRALFAWNINIAASNPEQRRLRRALEREDLFSVAIDIFPTDTTDLADIVLPAASFLEFDDLVSSYFHLTLGAQVKAVEPPGEALPNQEIFRRLARAMGFAEPELFEEDEVMITRVLDSGNTGETFASLASKGTVAISREPVIQFPDLRFPTPSGKIELASDAAEQDGHPRTAQPRVDERPAGTRLRLLSPASPWLLNDSFANDPKVAKRIGSPSVTIHPAEAEARGLAESDQVVLENETGRLALRLAISDSIPRGVALAEKGRWPKREDAGANVNALNGGEKSDMGESTAVHGVEVLLRRGGSDGQTQVG